MALCALEGDGADNRGPLRGWAGRRTGIHEVDIPLLLLLADTLRLYTICLLPHIDYTQV